MTAAAAAGLLAVGCTPAGGGRAAEPGFDLAAAARARRQLERMPAAVAAFRGGRYDEACRILAAVRAALPEAADAATAAALLELADAPAYRRLLASVDHNLGLAHYRARRFTVAEEHLRRAARTDPGSAGARSSLGLALLRQHRHAEALAAFEQAVRRGADDPRLHLDIARAARAAGEEARARTALGRALARLRPRRDLEALDLADEALVELALIERDAGALADAAAHLERVVARSPGMVQARYHLAAVLARQGREAEAAAQRALFDRDAALHAEIQHRLAENPGAVETLGAVAAGYERLGLLHLAAVHYRQLQARDPGDVEALRGLRRIRRGAG